jgi:hypothetical protein
MSSKSRRQQTIAKRNRERAIEERRTLKREKKRAAAAARAELAANDGVPAPDVEEQTSDPEDARQQHE